jgi:hypothetical protein
LESFYYEVFVKCDEVGRKPLGLRRINIAGSLRLIVTIERTLPEKWGLSEILPRK